MHLAAHGAHSACLVSSVNSVVLLLMPIESIVYIVRWRAFVRDIRTFVAEDNAEVRSLMWNIQEVMNDSDS